MPDALTSAIEAAVGATCLVAAVGTWTRPGLRLLSIAFAVAGVAAVVHAAISFV